MRVTIVPTGTANLASVLAALRRAGAAPLMLERPEEISAADRLMLPGVGSFGASLAPLMARGYAAAIRERIAAGRPTLAICVGLQILCESSEETPAAAGLGVLPLHVRRFGDDVRVPQLGWNRVTAGGGCRLLSDGYAYFANSYCVAASGVPATWQAATARHGLEFYAGFERGAVLACQFHPELSGAWGHALLERWLAL